MEFTIQKVFSVSFQHQFICIIRNEHQRIKRKNQGLA